VSAPADPAVYPGEIALKTHAAMGRVHRDQGVDAQYGRRLFSRLRAMGLVGLGAEARLVMVAAAIMERRIAAGQLRPAAAGHD
jgi:hypothetical protein